MLLSLLFGFSAQAGTFANSTLTNKISSTNPCVGIECLNLREDDTEHIFPPISGR